MLRMSVFDQGMLLCYTNTHSFHERTHYMQPAIILDLQKEFLTEATSAPKLFRDLGTAISILPSK
jgi:hypothetical protein